MIAGIWVAFFRECQQYLVDRMYHSFEAYEKGQELHMEAMPTQAAMVHKEFEEKKTTMLSDRQKQMLSKYGGSEHLNAVPKELLLSENET